jgi:hypothetical protein
MKSLIKNMMASLGLLSLMLAPALVVTAPARADSKSAVCQGVNAASGVDSDSCGTSSGEGVDSLVEKIIDILSWVVGVVAVIAIIVGGLRFILAGGDAGKIASARNTILYAIVGLVIVAIAQLIVLFVLQNVTPTT